MEDPLFKQSLLAATVMALALSGSTAFAQSRDQIRIVGSSTVFPFSSAVAEQFGKTSDFKTPVVESTGSGGGMKLFCQGVGLAHPDIANASRRIKDSEFNACTQAGITITEVKIGFDGIVLADSKNGPNFNLTKKQIFLALAKDVPVKTARWSPTPIRQLEPDRRPPCRHAKIEVLGPPPTSGTRDAFVELAMEGGAKTFEEPRGACASPTRRPSRPIAHAIREDGALSSRPARTTT